MKSINFFTGPAASTHTRDSIATGLHATFGHFFVILSNRVSLHDAPSGLSGIWLHAR